MLNTVFENSGAKFGMINTCELIFQSFDPHHVGLSDRDYVTSIESVPPCEPPGYWLESEPLAPFHRISLHGQRFG